MNSPLHVERFESATILLPVINETISLRQTVDIILRDARQYIKELLILVCKKTTPAAMMTIREIQDELGDFAVVHRQTLPFLGGALREGFQRATGSHVVMMSSDLETDPSDVRLLIDEARQHPAAIITLSRWGRGGAFHGYSRLKLVCNWVFNRFFSLLYGTSLSDMTFGYRILPTRVAQGIAWAETRHPFNLESVIKPLRLGVPVREMGSQWRVRTEGESQNSFFRNFAYFPIGFKVRFARSETFLKPVLAAELADRAPDKRKAA